VTGRIALFLSVVVIAGCGPLEQDDPTDAPGRIAYENRCAICHGLDGIPQAQGRGAVRFDDPGFREGWSRQAIVELIMTGKEKMPSFRGKVSHDEAAEIADYIKTRKIWNSE
jgi:mono/diheme cytochrome c family protein